MPSAPWHDKKSFMPFRAAYRESCQTAVEDYATKYIYTHLEYGEVMRYTIRYFFE